MDGYYLLDSVCHKCDIEFCNVIIKYKSNFNF